VPFDGRDVTNLPPDQRDFAQVFEFRMVSMCFCFFRHKCLFFWFLTNRMAPGGEGATIPSGAIAIELMRNDIANGFALSRE